MLVLLQRGEEDEDNRAAAAAAVIKPGMVRIRHTISSSCMMWPTVAHPSAMPVAQKPLKPKPKPLEFALEPVVPGQGLGVVPEGSIKGFRAGCKLRLKLQAVDRAGRAVCEASGGTEGDKTKGQVGEDGKGLGGKRGAGGRKIRLRLRGGRSSKEGGGAEGGQGTGTGSSAAAAAAGIGAAGDSRGAEKRWCCVDAHGWVVGAVPADVMEVLLCQKAGHSKGRSNAAGGRGGVGCPRDGHDKEEHTAAGEDKGGGCDGNDGKTSKAVLGPSGLKVDEEQGARWEQGDGAAGVQTAGFEVVVKSLRYGAGSGSSMLMTKGQYHGLQQQQQLQGLGGDESGEGSRAMSCSRQLAAVLIQLPA
jgi:hypothetical protein